MIQSRTRMGDQARQSTSGNSFSNLSSQCCEYIEDNPSTAVLIGFGLGLGAGVLLSVLLSGSSEDSYYERAESYAQKIGNQVRESLQDIIPSSWKNRLHS
jgi:hypothetical protein